MITEIPDQQAAWMLDQILEQPHVISALVFTADGLVQQHSGELAREDAERLAAALSGVMSASMALAGFCGAERGAWQQSLVEFAGGVVLMIRAGNATFLSVAVTGKADVGQVGWQMHSLVGRLGDWMGTRPRAEAD